MDKKEWYNLTTEDRLKKVLELQDQGYTATDLNSYFDVKTTRVINDFMNARGYRKKDNIYVPKDNTAVVPIVNIKRSVARDPEETSQNQTKDIDSKIQKLVNDYDKIQEIIKWYEKERQVGKSTALPIIKEPGEIKRTTIRINENIMAEFNSVWKENYSEYKQHDLLNIALQMFIDKYKQR